MIEEKGSEGGCEYSRSAAEITLGRVSSWDELYTQTEELGNEVFSEKTKELWKDFAVHGMLSFNKETGERELKPFTDLDGNSAIGILCLAGIDTSNMTYVKPGDNLERAINIDTGNKFGVVYNGKTDTAFFDHHGKGDIVTSATEVVYKAMTNLGMIKRTEALDRLVEFVTKVDNCKYPAEEFLRSSKTILGLQRFVTFGDLHKYFKDYESPMTELTPEQFDKYGLKSAAEKQEKVIKDSMDTLSRMEKEGKVVETPYGSILINENNELIVSSSAAYLRHDGIINFTPGKSFAVTLKEKKFDEQKLRKILGDLFQGKIIRGSMWIYNDKDPLHLSIEDLINALKEED